MYMSELDNAYIQKGSNYTPPSSFVNSTDKLSEKVIFTSIKRATALRDDYKASASLIKNMITTKNIHALKPITNQDKNQKKLRVGLWQTSPFVYITTDNNGKKKITGVLYDAWILVLDRLLEKGIYDEVEMVLFKKDEISGDDAIALIKEHKLDIIIGSYTVTDTRARIVNFTRPVFLNKIAYGYLPSQNKLGDFFLIFIKYFVPPMVILLLVSIIMGIIVNIYSPRQSRLVAIWQTIASLLGEAGYMSERLTDKYKTNSSMGYISVFIVMIIAFYFGIYLQATVTNALHYMQTSMASFTPDELNGKSMLLYKGYGNEGAHWKEYGMKVKLVDPDKDIVMEYLRDTSSYVGYSLDYEQLLASIRNHPDKNLLASTYNYGLEELAFPIVKNNLKLLQEINNILIEIQSEGKTLKICKSYITQRDLYLCTI